MRHLNGKAGARPFLFFGLVLACSLPFYLLNLLNLRLPLGLPPSAAMIVVPMLAALWLRLQEEGMPGVKALLRGIRDVRRINSRRWLIFSALAVPLLTAAMYWISLALGRQPSHHATVHWGALPFIFLAYLLGAVPEELGWTGYATGPMQQRFGMFRAGLIIGFVWEAWHLVPFVMQGRDAAFIILHSLAAVGARVVMGFMFEKTKGALMPALVYHAMMNAALEAVPGGIMGYDPLIMMCLTWALVAALYLHRKRAG